MEGWVGLASKGNSGNKGSFPGKIGKALRNREPKHIWKSEEIGKHSAMVEIFGICTFLRSDKTSFSNWYDITWHEKDGFTFLRSNFWKEEEIWPISNILGRIRGELVCKASGTRYLVPNELLMGALKFPLARLYTVDGKISERGSLRSQPTRVL